ncbi:MAG: J domain-containing protein [Alphaproteobacteria bacterium]|nr:J domain-containing protein [Alphaproteobacteria bacterium]
MPGCPHKGDHRAPKHRGLNEHYWFCEEHIREYNQAWDFFDGMPEREVQEHMNKSRYGDRPTWRYAGEGAAEDILRAAAREAYDDDESFERKSEQARRKQQISSNTPEFEALAIMGLEPPVTLDEIKARYKTLAKKHHPDINKDDPKSEELLKRVNMAYTILKLAYEEFGKLPDRA